MFAILPELNEITKKNMPYNPICLIKRPLEKREKIKIEPIFFDVNDALQDLNANIMNLYLIYLKGCMMFIIHILGKLIKFQGKNQ